MRLSVLVLTLTSLVLCQTTNSAAQDDTDAAKAILATVESRIAAFNPVWVKYEVQQFVSAQFLTMLGHGENAADFDFGVNAEVALKGNKIRTFNDSPQIHSGKLVRREKPFLFVFDGQTTIQSGNQPTQDGKEAITVSRNPGKAQGMADPWAISGYRSFIDNVEPILADPTAGKIVLQQIGTEKTRLELVFDNGWNYTFVFGGGTKFLLEESEVFDESGFRGETRRVSQHRSVQGEHFPMSATAETFLMDGSETLLKGDSLTVKSLEVSSRKIPDSLFELEIPASAVVFDADEKILIRDPVAIQARLDSIDGRSGRTPFRLLIFNGIALLLVGGSVFWFFKQRHNN